MNQAWDTRAEAITAMEKMGQDGRLDWRVGALFRLKGDSKYYLLWNNHLNQEMGFNRPTSPELV